MDTKQTKAFTTDHKKTITCCRVSPNGSKIATASKDGTVKIWDAHTFQLLGTFTGHKETVNCIPFEILQDDDSL
jgi:WD40 repeat protein